MFLAVPLLIKRRIAQTEIRREVDDLRRKFGILLDVMLRLSMRLGKEKDIDRLERGRIAELELRPLAQIRMDLIHVLAQMRTRGDLLHFDMRMAQQQPQQFPAAIT